MMALSPKVEKDLKTYKYIPEGSELDDRFPARGHSNEFWVITAEDRKCNIAVDLAGSCGKAIIPAGSVAVKRKNDLGLDYVVFWCQKCATTVGSLHCSPPPAELLGNTVLREVELVSFGFKHNPNMGEDENRYLIDVRKNVRNPWQVEALRMKTGLDKEVQDYIQVCPKTKQTLAKIISNAYVYRTIYVGCVGGRHRSVALVELAAKALGENGFKVKITHKDLNSGVL
jgi:hypothetical protein